MKFITRLDLGILGGPDSSELWQEITNKIPDSVLLKPGVKILNPACGHGTEAVILAKRMIALGIPKEKVNESFVLLDKYHTFTNQVRNTYGFRNVVTADFLEWKTDMKFDVVIGNPPFQENSELGKRKQLSHNLYSKFVQKGLDLTEPNGYVSMIIPTSWMTPVGENSKSTKLEFKNNFKRYNLVSLNINECSRHFNVGSTFSYFVLEKNIQRHKTKVICSYKENVYSSSLLLPEKSFWVPNLLNDISLNLVSRLMWEKFNHLPVQNDNFFHPVVNKTHNRELKENKTSTFKFPQFHTNAKVLWSDVPHKNQKLKKILFSKSGYLIPVYDPGEMGTTDAGFWVEVKSKQHANNLIAILNSKLFKFLVQINKWSGFNMPAVVQRLPDIDFSRSWSDAELYQYFGLTQAEIDLIETEIQ